jgi:hypothetical protein
MILLNNCSLCWWLLIFIHMHESSRCPVSEDATHNI